MSFTRGILLLLVLVWGSVGQSVRFNIAVNELSAKGIEQSDAEIISERLRSELLNTGVFKVMERTDMASVLKEQGFQQSGACDEASCLVEVGQVLGVERMVSGTVGKIGSLHTLSLRMISVMSGEILYYVNEDYQGELSGLLTTAVAQAARKLASTAGAELSTPPPVVTNAERGSSMSSVSSVGHPGIGAEELTPVASTELCRLNVVTLPQGAQVYLNDEPVGITPYATARLEPGNYLLKVTLDGYAPTQENLSLTDKATITKTYELEHTVAFLDSLKGAKVKSSKQRQWVRRIVFCSLAVGALGGGLYMNGQTSAAADVYNANRSEDSAVHDKNWDAYKSHARNRSLLYGLGSAFAAGFVLSIPF